MVLMCQTVLSSLLFREKKKRVVLGHAFDHVLSKAKKRKWMAGGGRTLGDVWKRQDM